MSTLLAKLFYYLRRFLAAYHGALAAAGAIYMLSRGSFAGLRLESGSWLAMGVVVVLCALVSARLLAFRPNRGNLPRWFCSIESGLLSLTLLYVVLQVTGGTASWLQPLAYLAVALLVGFNIRAVGIVLALCAIGLQAGLHFAAGELPGTWQPLLYRVGFISGFSLASMIFLQVEVALRRREHRERMESEVEAMREEAKDFRLISSALASHDKRDRAADEAKLAQGAVEAIHQGLYFVLELLKKSLDLRTCVLLWLDGSGRQLRIKELITDSSMVTEKAMPAQAGLLGGVVNNHLLLNLRKPPRGARAIPYYEGPEQVGAFLGVPIMESGHLRGVLCADRQEDRLFTEADELLAVEATRQVLRAIQAERRFAAVERAKYEHERFYKASTLLNKALTLSDVYETAFAAAEEIISCDFSAITLYDTKRRKHIICRVNGQKHSKYEKQEFNNNAGLVSMVVKNKHFLPAGDEVRERDTMIFTRKLRLKGMESLLVLPLVVKDVAIGTFVLASRSRGVFTKQVREMLGVITNQVAVSAENAKMYKKMKELATTDELTNLPNRRTFQNRLSEMFYRAERHNKPLSVVMMDIDKFKAVNDTHGHPVGDEVLRRMARVLAGSIRKVDLVARYGGEEFVMVLEDSDSNGAHLLSERVRQEMASQIMKSEQGSFRVTMSLGIASYPADGTEKEVLVDLSDQALYAAKESGRNRTVRYSEIKNISNAADSEA